MSRYSAAAFALAVVLSAGEAAAGRVPGDTMVYKSNGGLVSPFTVKTAPLPTYTFTVRGPQAREIFAMDFDNPANVLWGIDNQTREIGRIDVGTGAFTVVSPMSPPPPPGFAITGLSFDPTSSLVYVSDQNQSGSANLWTVDLTTGMATHVAGLPSGFVDIAIDSGGQMYGLNILDRRLYRIDKATGLVTNVGPTGMTFFVTHMGLDFDASDGTLYGCVVDGTGMGRLVSFSVSTGAATTLASADDRLECAVDVPATPTASLQAVALDVDAPGNRVLQPGESAVTVAPTWRNNGISASVTGVASAFGGPPGPAYTIDDAAAAYGTIANGAQASCTASGDCYAFTVAASVRPAAHWDASFDEVMAPGGAGRTWTLHIGDSFTDVPASNPFYRFVETLLHAGVTGGCAAASYCPASPTTRAQMAVFVLVARESPGYAPPPCTVGATLFADVPDTSPFCAWVEELANRGVVAGCGNGNYCPASPVTRDAMAVFVLRTLDPAISPPACGPPMFADVPAASAFCRWIEELARRGVVTGCGGGNYCPGAGVTREQMGVFLTVTFGLSLYGL